MNFLSSKFFALMMLAADPKKKGEDEGNPIVKGNDWLITQIVDKLQIVLPTVGTLAFIVISIMMAVSNDEHQRQKYKNWLYWVVGAIAFGLMAKPIMSWLQKGFS
ncbi:heme/copper-type cytochrome/quinol oxidase subunit 3 [Croceifilum oryzae]|uniref:Heme/copper-type cytochrome/quinol oxidase subunit 3 n=1 Tax=Croceifilum oryzae TaxID=1553429 RepID=A0AAJ1TH41_9BACL|nr:TrbC/VirB2 family protein [Croceifilum oryzae]MDQ0418758.1 heme/copper-type cytochrome/quinol oxidase subunit 3 [Croceifilum oryzae]